MFRKPRAVLFPHFRTPKTHPKSLSETLSIIKYLVGEGYWGGGFEVARIIWAMACWTKEATKPRECLGVYCNILLLAEPEIAAKLLLGLEKQSPKLLREVPALLLAERAAS